MQMFGGRQPNRHGSFEMLYKILGCISYVYELCEKPRITSIFVTLDTQIWFQERLHIELKCRRRHEIDCKTDFTELTGR